MKFKSQCILVLFAVTIQLICAAQIVKSRLKRYVVFPEGSSFSIAICLQLVMITKPSELLTEGFNWGINYDLPNNTRVLRLSKGKDLFQRRHRRDLYSKMETIMNSMGFSGRSCIFRALCEAGRLYSDDQHHDDIFQQILKTILKFPRSRILPSEPDEHRLYHWAYRVGQYESETDCWEIYPDCSFSLVQIFMDMYNENTMRL